MEQTPGVPSAFLTFGSVKGFFAHHGLKLEVQSATGGAAAIPALVSGHIQIAGSSVVSVILGKAKGLPLQVVAPGTQGNFGGLLVKRAGPIRSGRDLAGKTIGNNTLDNIVTIVVDQALEREGVDVSKVKYTEIPLPEMGTAVAKGQVDAAFAIEPFMTAGVEDQGLRVLPDVKASPNLEVGVYAATEQYVHGHADTIKAFQQSMQETATYIDAHQKEFRRFLAAKGGVKPSLARKMVLPHFTTGGVDLGSLQQTSALMHKYGIADKVVDAHALVAPGAGANGPR